MSLGASPSPPPAEAPSPAGERERLGRWGATQSLRVRSLCKAGGASRPLKRQRGRWGLQGHAKRGLGIPSQERQAEGVAVGRWRQEEATPTQPASRAPLQEAEPKAQQPSAAQALEHVQGRGPGGRGSSEGADLRASISSVPRGAS